MGATACGPGTCTEEGDGQAAGSEDLYQIQCKMTTTCLMPVNMIYAIVIVSKNEKRQRVGKQVRRRQQQDSESSNSIP